MISQQIIEQYEKRYKNGKQRININMQRCLWLDYQEFCLELSRKAKKTITASSRIRHVLFKDMIENE